MHETESERLLSALRRGEKAAFAQVYSAERSRVFGFLLRLCRDPNVAADLFQNTWLKLARSAAKLRADTDIRAWLFTVARNEYRSYCRAQVLDMSRLLALGREAEVFAPPTSTAATAEMNALEAALGALRDEDREVLLVVGVEGLELQQAAEVLGVSYAALRQRLTRARKRLAEQLEARESLELPAIKPETP